MKIFEYHIEKDFYLPDYISNDENICFLDIETDGLSHQRNNIILVGLFLKTASEQKIVQIFCDNPSEEKSLLAELAKLLTSIDTIITYNGASFDLPFIRKKICKYNMYNFLDSAFCLDLYKQVRKHKDSLNLDDCKLKTVERKLGIYREDNISGKESVILYKNYLSNPSYSLRKTILKHNYDDIYYLPDILKIESYLNISDHISVSKDSRVFKFNLPNDKIRFKKNTLKTLAFSAKLDSPNIISYEDFYTIDWNKQSGEICIEAMVKTGLLDDGRLASYIFLSDFNIAVDRDTSDLLVLSIENKLEYENIKSLVSKIIVHWI